MSSPQLRTQSDVIRIIALDLDDTVLLSDGTMTDRMTTTLQRAKREGKHIVFASARPLQSMLEVVKPLQVAQYCVALNGAVVADIDSGNITYKQTLPEHIVKQLLSLRETLLPDNTFFDYPDAFAAWHDGADVLRYKAMGMKKPVYVGDLSTVDHSNVCRFAFRVSSTPFPALEKIQAVLGDAVQYVVWEDDWSFVEILPATVSKASALAWLVDEIGYTAAETIAVGDERNDIEMLKWAGIGVAMGNARDEVKRVADYVTKDVQNDGCAHAIESFVLGTS